MMQQAFTKEGKSLGQVIRSFESGAVTVLYLKKDVITSDDLRSALLPAFGADPTIDALTLPELERLALVYAKQLRERSAPKYAQN